MKNLKHIIGARALNRTEQRSINGGNGSCGYQQYWCNQLEACLYVWLACEPFDPSEKNKK